jgi:hypothetical protein
MKKLLIALTIAGLLSSCSKKDQRTVLNNAWNLYGTDTHTTSTYPVSGNTASHTADAAIYSFIDANGRQLSFQFTETPSDGAVYNIQQDITLLKKGEVFITILGPERWSGGLLAISGVVKTRMAGAGKWNLTCKDISMRQIDSLAYSVFTGAELSANVMER